MGHAVMMVVAAAFIGIIVTGMLGIIAVVLMELLGQ